MDQLAADGPPDPVGWRFGLSVHEALVAALQNLDDHRAHSQRDEQLRAAHQTVEQARLAAKEPRRQQRKEGQRRRQTWPYPTCSSGIRPDDYDDEQGGGQIPEAQRRSCRSERQRLDWERTEVEGEWERKTL
ncbi:hypothetical protein PV392_06470 [Streptomyces sp. ME03-5709C]|nr:hypothetical protein [Streptomyces sp. ME03-5709C]